MSRTKITTVGELKLRDDGALVYSAPDVKTSTLDWLEAIPNALTLQQVGPMPQLKFTPPQGGPVEAVRRKRWRYKDTEPHEIRL